MSFHEQTNDANGASGGPRGASKRQVAIPEWRAAWHPGYPEAPFPMCFTGAALGSLLASVGSRPPESGAKGFCPFAVMGFDLVEFDERGSSAAGGAVYSPDVAWGESRQRHHLDQPDELVRLWSGDIHSHPGSFGHPSSKSGKGLGDLGYVEEVFAMNELMEWFLLPILTGTGNGAVLIHPWVCRRGNPLELFTAEVRVCDVAEFPEREFNPAWEKALGRGDEAAAHAGAGAPNANGSAPCGENGGRETIDLGESKKSVGAAPDGPGGEGGGDASAGGVAPLPVAADADRVRRDYVRRLDGVVSPAFRAKTILTVGIGAGSYAVEKLARLCPRRLRNCDFDRVEIANLSRTAYGFEDAVLGRFKVEALARRIRSVNPLVDVESVPKPVTDLDPAGLDALFDGVDLVVAGTDDFAAQALINREAVARQIAAVFVGIHEGARGGRVVWYVPGLTPCYRCVAKERFEAVARGGHDGPVNLTSARGSLIDCQFIDMVALKVAGAILERGQDSAMGRFFAAMGTRNDIVIRCDPDYGWGSALWGAILSDLPTTPKAYARELQDKVLLAMDSIWLEGQLDPQCPVCGECHDSDDVTRGVAAAGSPGAGSRDLADDTSERVFFPADK